MFYIKKTQKSLAVISLVLIIIVILAILLFELNFKASVRNLSTQTPVLKSIPSGCFVFNEDLEYGAYGRDVTILQKDLQLLGYSITDTDGGFHTSTALALDDFQRDHNLLAVTGSLNAETRAALNKLYGCGVASDYGLSFGNSDHPVTYIDNASTSDGNIISGSTLSFDVSDDLTHDKYSSPTITFPSRDYKATGQFNDADYGAIDYSFATDFSGNTETLKNTVCNTQNVVGIGPGRYTLIDCQKTDNGYIGYIVSESNQSLEISLNAVAAISTGSSEFPTAYITSELDDAILNEMRDGALNFPDKPALTSEDYVKSITAEYNDPNSSIAMSAKSFLRFAESVKGH